MNSPISFVYPAMITTSRLRLFSISATSVSTASWPKESLKEKTKLEKKVIFKNLWKFSEFSAPSVFAL
jgi:hypothetical protein